MNIVAFAATNSQQSINKQFLLHVLKRWENHGIDVLDLNDFELPLYSIDREKSIGIPSSVGVFVEKLAHADLIVIALSEHNGTYTAVFKNLFDWLSRYQLKMFDSKKLILLSTAPGPRGGRGVMDAALLRFPIHGAEIIGHFCLPKFSENFHAELGIINESLHSELNEILDKVDAILAHPSVSV